MTESEVLITSDAGVHARPAMLLVKTAMKYPCEIFFIKDNIEANAKSIMGVLALAITKGSILKIKAIGEQEEDGVSEMIALIKDGFNKEEN